MGIFGTFIFYIAIFGFYQTNELNYIKYCIKVETVDSYSVEMKISKPLLDEYEEWLQREGIVGAWKHTYNPFLLFLHSYLTEKLSRKVIEYRNRGIPIDFEKINIAYISLDFAQREVIKLLNKRGMYMNSLNFEAASLTEEEIEKYIAEHPKDLRKPLYAFITFEQTEGAKLARKLENTAISD